MQLTNRVYPPSMWIARASAFLHPGLQRQVHQLVYSNPVRGSGGPVGKSSICIRPRLSEYHDPPPSPIHALH